jgi:L-ascorbate 6-phosphate lactonase
MKYTFLGQAGFLIESGDVKIIVDPYLSDSVFKVNPKNYRRAPIDESYFDVDPDFLLITHNHLDHYDPESAPVFLKKEKPITVLGPTSVWNESRKNGGNHNYVEFNAGTEWTEKGLRFTAVKAVHSDPYAIGFIIEELCSGERVWLTGDTLYSKALLDGIPEGLLAIFLPINGVGNNMNATDAARLAKESGAKVAVPIHFGMFDEIDPKVFGLPNAVIPEIYKEVNIGGNSSRKNK